MAQLAVAFVAMTLAMASTRPNPSLSCIVTSDCTPLLCPCCNVTAVCFEKTCRCSSAVVPEATINATRIDWDEPHLGSNPEAPGGGASGSLAVYMYVSIAGAPVIRSASIILRKGNLDKGTATDSRTRAYARKLGSDVKADDAGHILANRLGGCGSAAASSPCNGYVNIFPQNPSVNRGSYKTLEGKIYNCLATGGATKATLDWTFAYQRVSGSPATRPSSYTYKAVFDKGCNAMFEDFKNP